LILYAVLFMYFFVQIMMGDCESEVAAELAKCEEARSNAMNVLALVSIMVVALLIWAFFVRGRRKDEVK
jgi:hypothetical protein